MRALSVCTVVTLSPNDAQAGKASASNKLGSNRRTVFPFGNPKGAGRFIVCPLMALPTNTRRNLAALAGSFYGLSLSTVSFYRDCRNGGLRYKRVSMAFVSWGGKGPRFPQSLQGVRSWCLGRS